MICPAPAGLATDRATTPYNKINVKIKIDLNKLNFTLPEQFDLQVSGLPELDEAVVTQSGWSDLPV